MRLFARAYGGHPRHLAAVVIALAFGVYGWTRIAQNGPWHNVAYWFVGVILAHDLVLFPLYRAIYEVAHRAGRVQASPRSRGPILQHVVVPAAASGLLLIVWLPLIAHPGTSAATYESISGVSSDPFLGRWALITAGLFVVSGLVYAGRFLRSGRDT